MAAAVQCLVSGFELSMRMHIAHLWILLLIVTLPINLVNTFVSFTWPIIITAEKLLTLTIFGYVKVNLVSIDNPSGYQPSIDMVICICTVYKEAYLSLMI